MQFRLAKNASGPQDAFPLFSPSRKPILLRLMVAEEREHLMKLEMGSDAVSQSVSDSCYCTSLPSDCLFDCVIIPQFRFHFLGSCNFHQAGIFPGMQEMLFVLVVLAASCFLSSSHPRASCCGGNLTSGRINTRNSYKGDGIY